MRPVLKKSLAKRGAIFLTEVQFIEYGPVHAKYCILLEDLNKFSSDILVAFSTTNLRFSEKEFCVYVEANKLNCWDKPTLIDLNNHRLIDIAFIIGISGDFKLQLPPKILSEIDDAIEYVTCSKKMYLRMIPNY